jgi:hypothetical protein
MLEERDCVFRVELSMELRHLLKAEASFGLAKFDKLANAWPLTLCGGAGRLNRSFSSCSI